MYFFLHKLRFGDSRVCHMCVRFHCNYLFWCSSLHFQLQSNEYRFVLFSAKLDFILKNSVAVFKY